MRRMATKGPGMTKTGANPPARIVDNALRLRVGWAEGAAEDRAGFVEVAGAVIDKNRLLLFGVADMCYGWVESLAHGEQLSIRSTPAQNLLWSQAPITELTSSERPERHR
jgi:hypothetical protein